MKQIVQCFKQTSLEPARHSAASRTRRAVDTAITEMVHARFRAIWKRKWIDELVYAGDLEVVQAEWTEELADLTPEQIDRGVRECRRHLEWPPDLATFRAACLGRLHSAEPPSTVDVETLNMPRSDPAVAMRYVAQMRQILDRAGRSADQQSHPEAAEGRSDASKSNQR